MRFDLRTWKGVAVVIGGLAVAGSVLRVVEAPAWRELRAREPAWQLAPLEGALGQGVTVGLLGGFRALLADLLWIRAHVSWEKRDLPPTQTLLKVVTAVDPRPLYFWLNGSRIIGYDMPNWRIVAEGGYDAVPAARQRAIDAEQARVALERLETAQRFHPGRAALDIEIANVHLNRLKDNVTAAEYYRMAAGREDAPFYAARIYAELLRREGRLAEAHAWLVELYPTLPWAMNRTLAQVLAGGGTAARNEAHEIDLAMADVVLQRIRELEEELGMPAAQRFVEPRAGGS